jgi:hypothetical protein
MFTFVHYNSQDEYSEQQAGCLDNNAVLIGFVESPEKFDKMLIIVRQRHGSDRKREDDGMWSNKQTEIVLINENAQIINLASGSNLTVGEGLESCTYDVNAALDFELDGRVVKLIDTPGFDDTNRSDTDILATIASHLEKACVVLLRLILMGLLGGLDKKPG